MLYLSEYCERRNAGDIEYDNSKLFTKLENTNLKSRISQKGSDTK